MYSHPITTSHGTVGVRSVEGAAFDDLTALAGDGTGLGSTTGSHLASRRQSLAALLILSILVLLGSVHDHGRVLLVLVNSPVEDVVVLEGLADEEVTENLAEVGVIGLVVEAERTSVVQVDGEFVGETTA